MSKSVSHTDPGASAARRRLLDTATRLFYAEGIRAVGIDRIIAEAGVAKATFYNHFPSKDDLVLAYIEEQDRLGREAVAALPKQRPRKMIAAILGRISDAAVAGDYRGCPFLTQRPSTPTRQAPCGKPSMRGARGITASSGNFSQRMAIQPLRSPPRCSSLCRTGCWKPHTWMIPRASLPS